MFPIKLFVPLILPLLALSLELPPWIAISGGCFIVWRLSADLLKFKKPSRKITGIFSVIFLIGIIAGFSTLLGREAAGSFLFILTGLKILEYNKEEESLFLILLGLFLICTVFLFNIDLVLSLCLGIDLFYLSYLLIPENLRRKEDRRALKLYITTVLMALPLTLFLFFFFPRLSEVLWKLNTGSSQSWALSGFSDDLKPGSIGEIVKSTRVVFRSDFINSEKVNRDLYWRGEVLTEPRGLQWKKSSRLNESYQISRKNKDPDYHVVLEPQNQRWLFTLEGTNYVQTDILRITTKPTQIFRVSSQPEKALDYFGSIDYTTKNESSPELYLNLPDDFSPRVQKLIDGWKLNGQTPEKITKAILNYFQTQKFRYTLNPGDSGQLTLDKFLFETKKGFCEHYASALALMLRAAHVPARVVVGFQGGVFNEFGHFWMVREKEAHAWVEYLNSKGQWRRADATDVVAPLRIELGAEEFFNLPEELQTLKQMDEAIRKLRRHVPLYEQFVFWVQGLNYRWTSWLMNFDLERQKELLRQFPLQPQFLTLIALILCLAVAYFIQRTRLNLRLPDEDNYYLQILKWKEVQALQSATSLGPTELETELQKIFPMLKSELNHFFKVYILTVYASQKEHTRTLKKAFQILNKKHKLMHKND